MSAGRRAGWSPSRLLLLLLLGAGCASSSLQPALPPVDPASARYRALRRPELVRAGPVAVTRAYREVIGPLLASRCRMIPNDSEYFDWLARSCGVGWALVRGIARVFLELGATAELLPTTVTGNRLRYLDLPPAHPPCGPP